MLFSPLLLLGVLSTVSGHAEHAHHHRALAQQLGVAPPSSSTISSAPTSSPAPASPAAAKPTQSVSLAGAMPQSGSPPGVGTGITTTLPDATLTATDPNIPPLSDITSGQPSPTPIFTFVATLGAPGPYPGAPPLPSTTLDQSKYPSPTELAPTDYPLMTEWLKELEGVQIPNIPPTTNESICSDNPEAANDPTRCWWTCGGCTNPTDIFTCPDEGTWGVTFDDGPAPYSPAVHQFLVQNGVHATFFSIASNAYYFSDIMLEAYMQGNQIGHHTWRHYWMTGLSTMQVIAELGVARELIKDVLGVTPTFWRPPYGDVDDRVRSIAMAMGMRTVLWTRDPKSGAQYDTNDWRIPAGQVTGPQAFEQFQNIIHNSSTLNSGFIVLEHDLYPETVDLAVGYTLPAALTSTQPKLTLKSVVDCLHLPMSEAYNETRTIPFPNFVTSWTKGFVTIDQVIAQSNGSSSSSSSGSGSGAAGTRKSSGGSLALTASLKHVILVLIVSTLAIVFRS